MRKIVIQIRVLKYGVSDKDIEPCEVNWSVEDNTQEDVDQIQDTVNELYAAIRKLALS